MNGVECQVERYLLEAKIIDAIKSYEKNTKKEVKKVFYKRFDNVKEREKYCDIKVVEKE